MSKDTFHTNRNIRQYRNPPLTTIRLLNGNEVRAHINGTSFDDQLGYAFIDGREMVVRQWLDGQWYEQEEEA